MRGPQGSRLLAGRTHISARACVVLVQRHRAGQHAIHQGVRGLIEHHHECDGDVEADEASGDRGAQDVRGGHDGRGVVENAVQLCMKLAGRQRLVGQERANAADGSHAHYPDRCGRAFDRGVRPWRTRRDSDHLRGGFHVAPSVQRHIGVNQVVDHGEEALHTSDAGEAATTTQLRHGTGGAALARALPHDEPQHRSDHLQATDREASQGQRAQVKPQAGDVAVQEGDPLNLAEACIDGDRMGQGELPQGA
mmetsp:Transcript_23181/g.46614  ORF Transcript_23181/g.46614 Transcript_23181/m.46614 type:complete len:251 (-) Transcript_23181:228-980(-)